MPNFSKLIPLFLLSACATLSGDFPGISLSDMEKVRPGQTYRAEVQDLFGRPQEIRLDFQPNEVWVYRMNSDLAHNVQNASFTFDRQGLLIGAMWLPARMKHIFPLQEALSHFKNSKFEIAKKVRQNDGHYYSNDTQYVDEKQGISFILNGSDQAVRSVIFGPPNNRVPAKL